MKHTYRILSLILALLMLFALSACHPREEETETESVDPASVPGAVSGNTYLNEFFGMRCELNNDWYICSEEDIAQIYGMTVELYENTDAGNLLESSGSSIDFYATRRDGTTVNIVIEQIDSAFMHLHEELIAESMIQVMEENYASMGWKNIEINSEPLEFMGEQHTGIRMSATVNGMDAEFLMVFLVKNGYTCSVTITCPLNPDFDDILAAFSPIEDSI